MLVLSGCLSFILCDLEEMRVDDCGRLDANCLPKHLVGVVIVSSGPVALDIRPLSDHQKLLISSILMLRSRGWSDRQIANHFNETGYLTPRGCRFIAQSVFSIRKKYEMSWDFLGNTKVM